MHWHAPECKGFHIHTPKASQGQLQRQTEIYMICPKYATACVNTKVTFGRFEIKMGVPMKAIYQNIITEYKENFAQEWPQNIIHGCLKRCFGEQLSKLMKECPRQWRWVSIGGIIRRQ